MVLNQSRHAIEGAPCASNREEAGVNTRLIKKHSHYSPDAQRAPHVLRVGHHGERKALIPGNRLPKTHSVVNPFFAQRRVDPHVQNLARSEHSQPYHHLKGRDTGDFHRRHILADKGVVIAKTIELSVKPCCLHVGSRLDRHSMQSSSASSLVNPTCIPHVTRAPSCTNLRSTDNCMQYLSKRVSDAHNL